MRDELDGFKDENPSTFCVRCLLTFGEIAPDSPTDDCY